MDFGNESAPPILLKYFNQCRLKNPKYSLRAFSRRLNLSPASLSQILSGKRKLTLEMVNRLTRALDLSPTETKELILSCLEKRHDERFENQINFYFMDAEKGAQISDWHYFAILSLGDLVLNYSRPEWIARMLGIHVKQASEAFHALESYGILERVGRGFKQRGESISLACKNGSPALRRRYHKLLEKARISLIKDSVAVRDFSSITMAIDETKLDAAREKILKFRRELCEFLESGKKTRVYNLSVQLFPLSESTSRRTQ